MSQPSRARVLDQAHSAGKERKWTEAETKRNGDIGRGTIHLQYEYLEAKEKTDKPNRNHRQVLRISSPESSEDSP